MLVIGNSLQMTGSKEAVQKRMRDSLRKRMILPMTSHFEPIGILQSDIFITPP